LLLHHITIEEVSSSVEGAKVAAKSMKNLGSFKSGRLLLVIAPGHVANSSETLSSRLIGMLVILCMCSVGLSLNWLNICSFFVVTLHKSDMKFFRWLGFELVPSHGILERFGEFFGHEFVGGVELSLNGPDWLETLLLFFF
jgi:hypothetical protein